MDDLVSLTKLFKCSIIIEDTKNFCSYNQFKVLDGKFDYIIEIYDDYRE